MQETGKAPPVLPSEAVTEREPQESLINKLAKEYPESKRLQEKWTRADVETYLGLLGNKGAIKVVRSETIDGLITEFHEMAEIDELEKIMGETNNQPNSLRDSLRNGTLKRTDIFAFIDGKRIQSMAHAVALKTELTFTQYLAEKIGFAVGRSALALTSPRRLMSAMIAGGDITKVWAAITDLEDELSQYEPPQQADVLVASQFWEKVGITYSKRAKALFKGATLKKLSD